MQQILEHIVGIANDLLWSKLLIVLLLSFGIYFYGSGLSFYRFAC